MPIKELGSKEEEERVREFLELAGSTVRPGDEHRPLQKREERHADRPGVARKREAPLAAPRLEDQGQALLVLPVERRQQKGRLRREAFVLCPPHPAEANPLPGAPPPPGVGEAPV